jgi:hypothetical protein
MGFATLISIVSVSMLASKWFLFEIMICVIPKTIRILFNVETMLNRYLKHYL